MKFSIQKTMMDLQRIDYFWQQLVLRCPDGPGQISAKVKITQPQGYVQQMSTDDVKLVNGDAQVKLFYPLIDDGRYDASHGTWNGAWEMGEYVFEVELYRGAERVAQDSLSIDPSTFFPTDHRYVIAVDAQTQFVEATPVQALYTDENQATLLIRIREHRVTRCHVEIDVVARESSKRLAGPWKLRLSHQFKRHSFGINDWPDAEYWIRIRLLVDGQAVGPYCVRKFWKQAPTAAPPPDVIEMNGYPEVLVDNYSFDEVSDVQFVPQATEKPKGPVVECAEPHEEEMIYLESLGWNEKNKRFECVYNNAGCSGPRKDSHEERAHLKMLLISDDGEQWDKPKLGLVDYHGSKDNNIVRDDRDNPSIEEREKIHDIEHAQFRFYDAKKDGPINIENVFLASGKKHFPFACKSLQSTIEAEKMARAERGEIEGARGDGLGVMPSTCAAPKNPNTFAPRGGEHWPFEKRGDVYLVLTPEPMLFLGIGMDLMHTTESIRCHVEYVGEKKRLLWYFRPGSPAYPPHGAPCDNMNMCLRCLAVLWTDDGLNYYRRFVITTDAFDPIGAQFYDMGMLQEFGMLGDTKGRPVLNKLLSKRNQAYPKRNLYLGETLLHWGIEQTQAPELIWTRDFLNFRRFKEHRRSFIDIGAPGSFDCGMVRPRYEYLAANGQWWHYYTGINTRHNGYTVMANNYQSPEELKKKRPSRCYTQYFTTWEGDYADAKATRYLPGLARCKAYRVACAEPVDTRGALLSHPIRVQQGSLRINAATEPGGSISIEIEDAQGKALLPAAKKFVGDQIDAEIADLSELQGQAVRIRFVLDRARLFAFCL